MRDKRTKADPRRRLAVAVAATVGAVAAAPLGAQVNYSGAVLYPLTAPPGNFYDVLGDWAVAGQTVGDAQTANFVGDHAVLYSGPSGSAVDLTPAGFQSSSASSTDGTQQVGAGAPPGPFVGDHALLWSGTAASAVDLNPTGFAGSEALAVNAGRQVGLGSASGLSADFEAILWSGTAASAVDLSYPTGFEASIAYGVSGNQQVGEGGTSGGSNSHALLWSGMAASAVDLNPAGFDSSQAKATNGIEQAGYGYSGSGGGGQALLWSGTAQSAIALQPLLPGSVSWIGSNVTSIDAAGNAYGIAQGIVNGVTESFSVEWSPVPNNLTWNNAAATGDGKTWDVDTSQNWSNGMPTVFNLYDNVTFNDANNGNYNVTLNTLVAATSVTFANNAGNYSLTGSGGIGGAASLALTGSGMVTISTSNSYTGPTTVTGGRLVIGAADALPAGNAVTIGNGTSPATMQLASGIGQVSLLSLTINPGGVLDITNNSVAINYVTGNSPASAIRQLLASGYGSDTWTGPGIDSSAAAVNPGRFAIGYADGNVDQGTSAAPNQVLVAYTLAGDANLDGKVNFADLLVVAQNFNHTLDTQGNAIDWADGDFNYDGKVNFADLLLVAQNFNQRLSAGEIEQLPGSFSAAWNLALAEVGASESTNVPEPTSVALLAVGAGVLLRRRKKSD